MKQMMRLRQFAAVLGVFALSGGMAFAGGHTWRVNEVFTDATGTIQFVEVKESFGGAGETGTGGHAVTSTTRSFTIPANVAPPTTNRHILLATAGFAALPGAPTPDYIIPAGSVPFFNAAGDTISYIPYDTWVIPAGAIPTDGVRSYNKPGTILDNSPTNYAGQTGTVNANPPTPPAVPDGGGPGTPMTVTPLDTLGTRLEIAWDTATCTGDTGFHIVFGQKTDHPLSPGGSFAVDGGVCGIGATPFTWNGVPDATDGFGLIWWLVLANDGGAREGSWGQSSASVERLGPMPDGSSGVCGISAKVLTNTCGN